ncbi:restriction endonuclease subunit S [Dolosicoccus paucivorans]
MITLNQEKLEKLQKLKIELLHNLFVKNRKNQPKIRLENFFDDWVTLKLGDVAPLRGGYAFKSAKFKEVGTPIIRISNITDNGNIRGDYVYYNSDPHYEKFSLETGDTLVAMSGATTGKVGTIMPTDYTKFYQNQRIGYFTRTKKIHYYFLSTWLKSSHFEKLLSRLLVARTQPNISAKDIDSLPICIPYSFKEQEGISLLFKNIDSLIDNHQQKVEGLIQLKNTYLQNLFI